VDSKEMAFFLDFLSDIMLKEEWEVVVFLKQA
jgi:hypothetical protein